MRSCFGTVLSPACFSHRRANCKCLTKVMCVASECCSVLRCVTVCCSVFAVSLQCAAEHYSAVQCVAVCCSVLQCVAVFQCAVVGTRRRMPKVMRVVTQLAVRCSELQYICSVLRCVAVCCNVLQCGTVCTSVLQWALADTWQRACVSSLSWRCVAVSHNVFAVRCSEVQCDAVSATFRRVCSVLQSVAACCSVLQRVAVSGTCRRMAKVMCVVALLAMSCACASCARPCVMAYVCVRVRVCVCVCVCVCVYVCTRM